MGLGKTIETIALLAFLKEYKSISGYHLIIAPKSVVSNWMKEFKKWLPCMRVVNLIATKEERERILKEEMVEGKFDVVVTTFEAIRLCLPGLKKFKYQYIIVDEAHKMKNEQSITSKNLRTIQTKYRLLLTGTPLQNNLHELWALLNFLLPEIFASADDFNSWFDLSKQEDTVKKTEEKNVKIVQQLHKILKPFLLRRIKKEAAKDLPPKTELHIHVNMVEM